MSNHFTKSAIAYKERNNLFILEFNSTVNKLEFQSIEARNEYAKNLQLEIVKKSVFYSVFVSLNLVNNVAFKHAIR